jgi:hypothetical protein
MFKLGDIVSACGANGTDYYIVVETGSCPHLELVEDYILRCRVVLYEGEYCTLREIVDREKQKILSKGAINA